jgi:hypothetical protein
MHVHTPTRTHTYTHTHTHTHNWTLTIAQVVPVNIEEPRGRLLDWIAQDEVSGEVRRRFRKFLKCVSLGLLLCCM